MFAFYLFPCYWDFNRKDIMRLEDYTDEELIIQIRNFDSEIERLKNYRDLFEKQININNSQERIIKND